MDNKEQGSIEKRENWEIALLFIGLLVAIVLALVGWYMEGSGSLPQ